MCRVTSAFAGARIVTARSFWGEIPGFQGVWAKHETLTGCQRQLRDALNDWIALRLRLNLEIPEIGHLNLNRFGKPASAGTISTGPRIRL